MNWQGLTRLRSHPDEHKQNWMNISHIHPKIASFICIGLLQTALTAWFWSSLLSKLHLLTCSFATLWVLFVWVIVVIWKGTCMAMDFYLWGRPACVNCHMLWSTNTPELCFIGTVTIWAKLRRQKCCSTLFTCKTLGLTEQATIHGKFCQTHLALKFWIVLS